MPLLTTKSRIVTILDYSKIDEYIKNGYFIFSNTGSVNLIAINNLKIIHQLPNCIDISSIFLVKREDFFILIDRHFGHLNTIKSKYVLNFISPRLTAKNVDYHKSIIGFFIIFFSLIINFVNIFHLINNVCYFSQNCLKIFLFKRALIDLDESFVQPLEIDLPIYTILVPLYKEEAKLKSILQYIDNLNYPKHKLDVKIIVEADDYLLITKITLLKLPSYIHIIKVPLSFPRTKPKALNYAMEYCIGMYAVVYDAEDRPNCDQLLRAVYAFHNLPDEYACLQAKLNFYNEDENLLTKFFSIEYSLWFDYLLKGLSLLDLPVTLGGTSNHFKVDVLKKVGMWDAYNVTEDADLGIRLYLRGYKVKIIDSYTLEEAPINLNAWINQRSRWIKGFIQTFFVFLGQKRTSTKIRFWQAISIYILVGISSYSFCCLPWLLLFSMTNSFSLVNYIILINSVFAFSYIYATACYVLLQKTGNLRNFKILDYIGLLLFPFYFLLHTLASYMAIWETLARPFEWNKTEHGVSKHDSKKIL